MPELLEKKRWDCAQKIELNQWARQFKLHKDLFERNRVQKLPGSFYNSVADIRHTAVHRLPVTANVIQQLLVQGELLATLLADEAAESKLSAFKREIQGSISDMRDYKSMLQAKKASTLKRIAAERLELDRQEKEAIESTIRADQAHQMQIGVSLERRLFSQADKIDEGRLVYADSLRSLITGILWIVVKLLAWFNKGNYFSTYEATEDRYFQVQGPR